MGMDFTPLQLATGKPSCKAAAVLLATGVDPDGGGVASCSALWKATLQASDVYLRVYMAAGADPNLRDSYGQTPLFAAVQAAHGGPLERVRMVQALLQGGADPKVLDSRNREFLSYAHPDTGGPVRRVLKQWQVRSCNGDGV